MSALDRVFVAGASGVVGRLLCRLLMRDGWSVVGGTRSHAGRDALLAAGVEPVLADVCDEKALRNAVAGARFVVHQITDLPDRLDPARMPEALARTARIREEGTRNLVAAAAAAGVERIVAQSIAFAYAPARRCTSTPPRTRRDARSPPESGASTTSPTIRRPSALQERVSSSDGSRDSGSADGRPPHLCREPGRRIAAAFPFPRPEIPDRPVGLARPAGATAPRYSPARHMTRWSGARPAMIRRSGVRGRRAKPKKPAGVTDGTPGGRLGIIFAVWRMSAGGTVARRR
jgi:hypothetical protein